MSMTLYDLRAVPLFAELDDETLAQLARYAQPCTYRPGQMIILEGTPCEEVYLIVHGLVRSRQLSPEGREHVLDYIGPGGYLNLVPALDGGPTLATVDALSEVTLYAIPCREIKALMRTHQQLATILARQLAAEVRRLSAMAKELALHTVRSRLARFLLEHAEARPSQHRWTQEAIAASIGSVRDVVGRTLRAFAEEGLIRREQGRIVVVNREALEHEAQIE